MALLHLVMILSSPLLHNYPRLSPTIFQPPPPFIYQALHHYFSNNNPVSSLLPFHLSPHYHHFHSSTIQALLPTSTHYLQDNSYLYLVLEFVLGGEMFHHLRQSRRFTCDDDNNNINNSRIMIINFFFHLSIHPSTPSLPPLLPIHSPPFLSLPPIHQRSSGKILRSASCNGFWIPS